MIKQRKKAKLPYPTTYISNKPLNISDDTGTESSETNKETEQSNHLE